MRLLVWGVRSSFIDYVRDVDGTIEVTPPARILEATTEFVFPGHADAMPTTSYGGVVSFEAHGGMLSVRLAAPRLETGSEGLRELSFDVAATGIAAGRRPIVSVAPDGTSRLTTAGVAVFNNIYPPGAPFAVVSVRDDEDGTCSG